MSNYTGNYFDDSNNIINNQYSYPNYPNYPNYPSYSSYPNYPNFANNYDTYEESMNNEISRYEPITTIVELGNVLVNHNADFTRVKGSFKITIFDWEVTDNFPIYKNICMRLKDAPDSTLRIILHKKVEESELTIQGNDVKFVTSQGQWAVSRDFLTQKNLTELLYINLNVENLHDAIV
ncbi:MAG: hypothetical protein Q8K60_09625 [Parachlamydiaceae bacterium]|nr:hypothetical protein [Parachlamydiaceae bacterium]